MLGFYLETTASGCTDTGVPQTRHLPYETFKDPAEPEQNVLYLFPDDRAAHLERGAVTLYTLGPFVYRGRWGVPALEAVCDALDSGTAVEDVLRESRGQFFFLLRSDRGLFLAADVVGTFPVYRYDGGPHDGTVAYSNLLTALLARHPVHLDLQHAAKYLNFNYPVTGTLFEEISTIPRGTLTEIGRGISTTVYEDLLEGLSPGCRTDPGRLADEITGTLRDNTAFLGDGAKVFSDLTGGFDSRLNAALLADRGVRFETGLCGEQNVNETRIAGQAAAVLGCRFTADIAITDPETFRDRLELQFEISNGVPLYLHSTELVNYYLAIRERADLHVAGFGGSELFDNFLPRLSALGSRLRPEHLIMKLYPYADIFRPELLDRPRFHRTLACELSGIISEFGTDEHDLVSSYFTLQTANRRYHGSLIAAHNTILPIYVPYFEKSIVRLLLETPAAFKNNRLLQRMVLASLHPGLSGLVTSSGFAAHPDAIPANPPAKRVKDILRGLSYDLAPLRKLGRTVGRLGGYGNKTPRLAELQRGFWVERLDALWRPDMRVFELLDRNRTDTFLSLNPNRSMYRARILYLERLLTEFPRILLPAAAGSRRTVPLG